MSRDGVHDALTMLLRGNKRLRPSTAVSRIAGRQPGLTRLEIRNGLAALAQEHCITGVTREGQVVGLLG